MHPRIHAFIHPGLTVYLLYARLCEDAMGLVITRTDFASKDAERMGG
jgi:hypothetical protein